MALRGQQGGLAGLQGLFERELSIGLLDETARRTVLARLLRSRGAAEAVTVAEAEADPCVAFAVRVHPTPGPVRAWRAVVRRGRM